MFEGCTFHDRSISSPVDLGDDNVRFPASWSHWRQAIWRYHHNCPGCGWTAEEGFRTVGVPTYYDEAMADLLNWVYYGSNRRPK
jgi:hypothetical protein